MSHYPQEVFVFHNGKFKKAADVNLPSLGAILHLTSGAYEGIRAYNTHNGARLFKAEAHFTRLLNSCEALGIKLDYSVEALVDITYRLLKKNKLRSAYIRPFVFSNPDLTFLSDQVSIIISTWEWGPFLGHQPLDVTYFEDTWSPPQAGLESIKFTNQYTRNILALRKAKNQGYDDALLMNTRQEIFKASSGNIFMEKDGAFYTPPTAQTFPGITRETVFELCSNLGIEIIERPISIEEFKAADSAFLCGTAAEIIGIKTINGAALLDSWTDSLGATVQRSYKNLVLEKENYEVII